MKRFSATLRIVTCLVGLSMSLLLTAHLLGLVPDDRMAVMRGRAQLCETMAFQFSHFAERGDRQSMETTVEAIADRNDEILSVAVRKADGEFLANAGNHGEHWCNPSDGRSTETHVIVPITLGGQLWGTVEMSFQPIRRPGLIGFIAHPMILLILFMSTGSAAVYYFFLRRVLRQLNPTKVVPPRVRTALDSLAEGLLLLNQKGQIVLANSAFGRTVRKAPEQLLGLSASKLPWTSRQSEEETPSEPEGVHPWTEVLDDGVPRTGSLMGLQLEGADGRTFVVNATPIRDTKGANRGVLASFEDVTSLEEKKVELSDTLNKLRRSSDEIRRQNQELQRLATRDPLTSCLNRRSFFEHFENHWSSALRYNHPLSCVMVDIDNFKSINDTHGHRVGDQVLQKVAAILQSAARESDVVCRYGGEEFAILLPHTELDTGARAAERFRAALEATPLHDMTVTASLGLSALSMGPPDPQGLLDQADKALYVAKRNGRNQVVRWDEVPPDLEIDETKISRSAAPAETEPTETIPFQAVTALLSALGYRDPDTAQHSQRVADLCLSVAEGLMSFSDCYVLENAALLHDIGKIGVPDSILLKPGRLTEEEWKVMRAHDRIGVEIIGASFASEKLTKVVGNHNLHFGGTPDQPGAPKGHQIPLGARILHVADAYDSMTSEHVYRKALTPKEAFAELRRCAGTQFDPELVERFISCVSERNQRRVEHPASVPRDTVLVIGQQIERLLSAIDRQDIPGLQTLAGRLRASSRKQGVSQIADKASELESVLESDRNLIAVLQIANELVDLCRATQKTYLNASGCVPCAAEEETSLVPTG
jgi:diguanylate cyclase (GGDEF)-like protein/putative nucleotidyltransferase with HDIG domain